MLDDLLQRQVVAGGDANPLVDQQTNFLRSVLGQETPRVTGEAGRQALAVARQILELLQSSQRHSTVVPYPRPGTPPRKAG
jgi:hypothetical protein